ncbi:MAG: DNA primase [Bacteroidales bacterium]|jgi:DNA primase|nr:DNA primase [Bacteroidales bacterium]
MIDRNTIDRIFEASRIVDVVEEFVSLKRRGVNYIGCCPFHNERTPSFVVSPAKNIYKCFGCGKAGNPVNFIMEHEHLSYPDALRYLAKKFHIEIVEKEQTPEEQQIADRRESLMIVSAYASRVFQENLFDTREGKAIGLSYFKERGFREDIIKNFELGYSLEARDAFTKKAIKEGYKEEFLIETGLSIKGENAVFDRFSARVMFPIHSLAGKVIAFGGRVLKADKKQAKYLNSPESDIYHKSKVLYGIFQARSSIVKNQKCYLVEGYTDVISMHQAGIENVVASSGTALTVEQIQLIKRFTENVTVLYDGDPAGIKASLRGIDLILQEGMNVKVLLLPDGEDPDSFSRKHSVTELEEYIGNHETDFINFKAQLLLDDAQGDPVKRARLITEVVQSISLIPNAIQRSVYLKESARMFDMDEQMLAETADTMRKKKISDERKREIRKSETDSPHLPSDLVPENNASTLSIDPEQVQHHKDIELAEEEIIRLLVSYGNNILPGCGESTGGTGSTVAHYLIQELRSDDLEIQEPLLRRIFNEYEQLLEEKESIDDKYFIYHADPEISRMVAGLMANKYVLSNIHKKSGVIVKTEEDHLEEVVPVSVLAYKNRRVIMLLKDLSLEMQKAEKENDTELLDELYARYISLNEIKKQLAKILGKRIVY